MKLHYSSRKLENILTNERSIKTDYGELSNKLLIRLSELRAARSLSEIPNVPPPRRHKLSGDKNECWGVDISKNVRLVVAPRGEFDINDLGTITEIIIYNIEDYH